MRAKRAGLSLVLSLLGFVGTGCGGGTPSGPDLAAPPPSTVGTALDERSLRTLPTTCAPPKPFYDALSAIGVQPSQLALPDWGISFSSDPNRLHYTDDIRKQGDTAPDFACMAAADVRAALRSTPEDTVVRELVAAMGLYGNRAAYQVSRYDQAFTVEPSAQAVLAALQQFVDHAPVEGDTNAPPPKWANLPAAQKDALATQAARLSPSAQAAIAQAIAGLLAAADLRDQALTANGRMTLADWQTNLGTFLDGSGSNNLVTFAAAYKAANKMVQAMDYDLLARAGQLAARATESLRLALAKEPLSAGLVFDVQGALGHLVIDLENAPSTWAGTDFFLLVDGGGDDTYSDDIAVNMDLFHPIAVILDLSGKDQYVPSQPWDLLKDGLPGDGGQGTGQAAGWFGIALLDDAAGDDVYQSTSGFHQAFGMWGVGLLIDHAGSDTYKGYARSQGASDFGYGMLADLGGGNDRYETLHNSQGFGGTRGIGWLVDDGGDDTYLAVTDLIKGDPANSPYDQEGSNFSGAQGFGFGLRVWDNTGKQVAYLSGGMGALFDMGGNDTYTCAVMCQGWGYFYGTGMLWDQSGNDSYTTWHKYGIGGATHQAVGIFVDGGGADHYEYTAGGIATNGGSEGVGLGYDGSVGWHIDRGPEKDIYRFDMDKQKWGEVLGIARFPALGVLINEGGDDEYHVPGVMGSYALGMTDMPYSNPPVRSGAQATTPSVGLYLDLGGSDTYDVQGSPARNDSTWTQKAHVANAAMDPFDPTVDHGYGFDGSFTWAPW